MADERIAIITGVSRRIGIAAAVARRLAGDGYRLWLTGWPAFDGAQPWGEDPDGPAGLLAELGASAVYEPHDLLDPAAPGTVVEAAVARYGTVDVLVAAHAYSTQTPFGGYRADEIDKHLIVNVRATMLLAEAYARHRDDGRPDGRIVLFSSGQALGPMPSELAYAASKAGVECLVPNLSTLLAGRGVTVNAVNPGPTDTGYAPPDVHAAVAARFPGDRWGTPEDAARLVGWLCSPDGRWVTGQVIHSEGGFSRFG